HEMTPVLLFEPLRGNEALAHLLTHASPDAAHLLGEHHARPPAGELEAHGGEMLRTEARLLRHDGRPLPLAAHREGTRAVREDGVRHRALQPPVEEKGGGADLDPHPARAMA